jgi:squalene synthase HpnC
MCVENAAAIHRGYRWCRALARSHYENFPVASWLLPRRLRDPVAAIYAFARSADDIADEGNLSKPQRLERLAVMETMLHAMQGSGAAGPPLYLALADAVQRHQLALAPFHDLLSACRRDLEKTRYANFGELMDYCRCSANPVGRLLLQLTGNASARNIALSDAVCSALQLINFLQDIDHDYHYKGRIYLPQDEMRRFGVTERDIAESRNGPQLSRLFRFQLQRAAQLLRSGSPLGRRLGGRFGFELRIIILSAARVIEKLHKQQDIFSAPRLHGVDRIRIMVAACRPGMRRRPDRF